MRSFRRLGSELFEVDGKEVALSLVEDVADLLDCNRLPSLRDRAQIAMRLNLKSSDEIDFYWFFGGPDGFDGASPAAPTIRGRVLQLMHSADSAECR